jgi:uncharacterized Tic20 family protein
MNTTNPPSSVSGSLSQEDRNWGLIAHLSALSGLIIPLGSVLGPLIVYLVKKDQSAFGTDCAKEALNFNITILIAAIICACLWLIFIGILLSVALFFFWLVLTILAAVRASEGTVYRYPATIRFVK